MSSRPRALTSALAAGATLACFLATPRASAQFSPTQEFQSGFSLLRFEPAKAGDRFFAVPDASIPGNASSRFRALLLADFVLSPILSRTNNLNGQTVDVISKQVLTQIDLGYFPNDDFYFGIDLPLALAQSGDSPTTPSGVALGDTRLSARYGLVGAENAGFSFGPALDVWVPTGSQDKLAGDGELRAEPMLAMSGREAVFVWSTQVGYQFRRELDLTSIEIGNSLTFGAAAGLLLFGDVLQIGPEIYGAALTSPHHGAVFSSRDTVLETLFGAKVHAADFVFGASAGPGLSSAPGTGPRVLLSAAFAPQAPYRREAPPPPAEPQKKPESAPAPTPEPEPEAKPPAPKDSDGDGVPDNEDACPTQQGEASGDATKRGCPPPAAPLPGEEDTDGDGIPDNEDACKRVPGVASETPSSNGCPPPALKAAAAPRPPPPVDSDGDGIPDKLDACPNDPGVHSRARRKNGCPVEVKAKPGAAAELTFAGFRNFDDGSSLVFVELSAPATVNVRKTPRAVIYTLENTRVPLRNNRNPLLTIDFSSIVKRATIKQVKKAVELTIELKANVEPRSQMVARGGASVLEIRLPKAPAGATKMP